MPANNEHNRHILQAIASGQPVTQRSLSDELGVALGLTNLLIRRLVAKGYIKMSGMRTRHVRYLMTASGVELLAHETRSSLENTVRLYTQTREHIRSSLAGLSERCKADAAGQKRIVFYGTGDMAEIAYVSLQGTDLTLIGVVDDRRTGRFFDLQIQRPEKLSPDGLGGEPFAYVVVASLRHAARISERLEALSIPSSRVSCL